MSPDRVRCGWAGSEEIYQDYHDQEWGVPLHDEGRLFEMLILEGAQAGLSWITILKRRQGYREVFDGFDAATIASYDQPKIERLLSDTRIIRNRLKVEGTVKNARAYLRLRDEGSSLDAYLWDFVDGEPIQNAWPQLADVPAETTLSKSLSKDLKKRGFTFVGPTICYAYMQSIGMVNDHTTDCFRYRELSPR
ncbi:MAG: DNA-3-methyladenine glycosylase I [Acidobacteriota bacterium]